jgi:hypothetical protein
MSHQKLKIDVPVVIGPKGDKGVIGDFGAQGDVGPTGPAGTLRLGASQLSSNFVELLYATTGSGSFTVPDNVQLIYVSMCGGGGGGGSCSAFRIGAYVASFGGGGGGAVGLYFYPISGTSGKKFTYTVGQGGAGGMSYLQTSVDGQPGTASSLTNGDLEVMLQTPGGGGGGAASGGFGTLFLGGFGGNGGGPQGGMGGNRGSIGAFGNVTNAAAGGSATTTFGITYTPNYTTTYSVPYYSGGGGGGGGTQDLLKTAASASGGGTICTSGHTSDNGNPFPGTYYTSSGGGGASIFPYGIGAGGNGGYLQVETSNGTILTQYNGLPGQNGFIYVWYIPS